MTDSPQSSSPETESEPFDDTRKLHMALQQIAWWEEQCRQQIARIEELEAHGHAQCSRVQEAQALADCAEGCLNCRNSAYPSDVLRECIKFLRGTCANSSTIHNSAEG